jgi:hypothetical protein
VLAGAAGQMAGLIKSAREHGSDSADGRRQTVDRGHQESNLTLRSEDCSVANAPKNVGKGTHLFKYQRRRVPPVCVMSNKCLEYGASARLLIRFSCSFTHTKI